MPSDREIEAALAVAKLHWALADEEDMRDILSAAATERTWQEQVECPPASEDTIAIQRMRSELSQSLAREQRLREALHKIAEFTSEHGDWASYLTTGALAGEIHREARDALSPS